MTVRQKLLLALAPLGVALALLGVVSVATISLLGQSADTILADNYRSVLAMQRISSAVERIDDGAALSLVDHDVMPVTDTAPQRKLLEAELQVEEGNLTEPGEGEMVARLRDQWHTARAALDRFAAAAAPERKGIYFDSVQPSLFAVRRSTEDVLALNQDAMVHKSGEAQRVARRMSTVMLAVSVLAFVLGLVLSLGLLARVLRRLQVLSRAVQRIGEHDFAARVEVSGTDELAQLATSVNRMAERLDEYRRSSLGELLQAQEASQAAIDSIPDPVLVFGERGHLLGTNQAADRLLGVSGSASATHPIDQLEPVLRAAVERVRTHVLGGKGAHLPRSLEEAVEVETPEGHLHLLPRATAVYSEDGAISGATVILQDVTRLHRFDELKNDLVATTAHELRTPLTSLRMAIHLCLEEAAGPLTAEQADLLHAARQDSERLQATIDELLDLARLQEGRLELRRRPVSVEALVQAAVQPLQAMAAERDVRIESQLAPLLPDVLADPDRAPSVLANLVTNAIRHSPAGEAVQLKARAGDGVIRIEVGDAGPGIPEEHRLHVFDRFYQAPGGVPGSSGLGLSIAREIVIAHGGEIGVEPNPTRGDGTGTVFWFTLPVAPPPAPAPSA